jgi:hypothetical protein
MSYDLDILVDVPGRDLAGVVEANLSGEPLHPGDVDLPDITARLRRVLSLDAEVEGSAESLWVSDPVHGLQLDLTREGGQVNLPLDPSPAQLRLAERVVAQVCAGTRLFGFDPQQEQRLRFP